MTQNAGPLSGVRVVELGSNVFVPICAAILADLGADVIKVEPPTGDPLRGAQSAMTQRVGAGDSQVRSPFVEYSNRGKRSVAVDLRTDDGRTAFYRLIATADVFVTNALADTLRKLKVDVDDLQAVRSDLIFARGTGWGASGPMAECAAYDLTAAWSGSGVAYLLAGKDGEPPPMPIGIFDLQSGLTLAGAIGVALFQRATTGKGVVVDTSLINVGMWAVQAHIVASKYTERLGPIERNQPGNALVNWYRTRDGRWILFTMMYAGSLWPELCRCLGRADLINDPRFSTDEARAGNAAVCAELLEATIADRTYEEWCDRFKEFPGAWAPVRAPRELHEHPQMEPNGFLPRHRTQDGFEFTFVAPPMHFDQKPTRPAGPAPEAGQQSEEVLLELGYDSDEIAALVASGAIGPR